MKKRILTLTMVIVIIIAGTTLFYAQSNNGMKIAVINPQKVLSKSIAGQKVMKKLDNLQKAKQKKLTRLKRELSTLENKLQTQGLTMSEQARMNLQKKIDAKKASLQQEYKNAQMDMQFQSKQLLGKVQKELEPIIKKIRQEKKIAIIFDVTRAGIVDMDKSIDITDEVIQRYNKSKLKPKKK
jgi:Skp family chaperone for outer membrane proteins